METRLPQYPAFPVPERARQMTSVRRALAISFIERYALIALGLASNILVARLLSPDQIGLYSVSLAVISVAQVLRDFGIGNFLIQEKNLDDAHIRTAFGISLLMGGVLFIVVFLVSPWAGEFYGHEQIVSTMRISSLNFLVLPFCTISLALLRREMQFDRVAIVTLVASAVGVSVTVALAFLDYGPNSMAIGAVIGNLVTGAGAWIARSGRNVLRPSLSEWRAVVKFGGQSSLTGVITSISMDANDLVVGKVLGFHPVAILSRAQGLMNLFHRDLMAAVRGVALPAFAAAHRRSEDIEAQHARSMAIVTIFAWPFYGLVSLYSIEVLRLLFGPQWDEAAALVPIFCIAGAISSVTALVPTLLLALGRIDLVTRAEMLLQPSRFVLIALAAIVFRSVEACSLAYLVITVATLPVFLHAKKQAISSASRNSYHHLLPSLAVTMIALVPALLHVAFSGFERTEPIALIPVIISCTLAVFGWLTAALWFNHPIAKEPLFLRLIGPLARLNSH